MKTPLKFLLRFGLVGYCLWYILKDLDLAVLGTTLANYPTWAVLLSPVIVLLTMLAPALRIHSLLQAKAPVGTCLNATLFGLGVSNILPAKLGEISKVYYLRKIAGIPLAKGLGTVFWERFADLNAVLLIGIVAISDQISTPFMLPLAGMVVLLWLFLLANKARPMLMHRLTGLVPFERIRLLIVETLAQLSEPFSLYSIFQLTAQTVLAWGLYLALHAFLLLEVAGLDLTWGQVAMVFALSSLSFAIPSSPGALGLFEAAIVLGLGLSGIDKSTALAAALLVHMAQFIPTTAWSLVLMATTGMNIQNIRKQKVAAISPADGAR